MSSSCSVGEGWAGGGRSLVKASFLSQGAKDRRKTFQTELWAQLPPQTAKVPKRSSVQLSLTPLKLRYRRGDGAFGD